MSDPVEEAYEADFEEDERAVTKKERQLARERTRSKPTSGPPRDKEGG